MKKLILDVGPLITSCRFTTAGQVVIDHLLAACDITIASSVRNEVVVAGQRYPDAQVAQQRINQASISVMSPPVNRDMEAVIGIYGLGEGEQDSMLLTRHSDLMDATLVLDDHLAYSAHQPVRQLQKPRPEGAASGNSHGVGYSRF